MADCLEKLREIAATESSDPGGAAGRIVREVKASTSGTEFEAIFTDGAGKAARRL